MSDHVSPVAAASSSSTVVVFDLGNVVIPWDRRDAIRRFVDDPDEVERIADEVFDLEANLHLDSGSHPDEIRAHIEARSPGHGWVLDGYLEHFRHSLGEVIAGTEAILDELAERGVPRFGLSNWSALCFEGIEQHYPLLERFDGILISGDVGVCKPEPGIYRECERRFGFTASDAVFLDDNADNVDGALAAGWDAFTFTTPEAARAELVARGLLGPA